MHVEKLIDDSKGDFIIPKENNLNYRQTAFLFLYHFLHLLLCGFPRKSSGFYCRD